MKFLKHLSSSNFSSSKGILVCASLTCSCVDCFLFGLRLILNIIIFEKEHKAQRRGGNLFIIIITYCTIFSSFFFS